GIRRVVPRNYNPKGERFLIALRFPTPPLACAFFSLRATETSSSKLARDQTSNPTSSTNPIPKGSVEAIVVPPILAEQFELKHSLINMMTSEQFFGLEKDNPHDHGQPAGGSKKNPRVQSPLGMISYIKANDAVLRNIQNQGQSTQNQCQGSGTLLGNTVTNLKDDLKGITTRSDVAYQGPTTLTPSKVTKQGTKTSQTLIDVHKGELTLRIGNEAITYNLDQTSRYSANYYQMTANKIDVIDEACEEYSQEVIDVSDVTASGSLTPSDDLIVSTTSPALTPFGDSDFLLFEEADAFLGLEDDPDSPELDPSYYDPEGDILSLKVILNSDPSPLLPNHEQSVPSLKEELKACEAKTIKSSIDEPPEYILVAVDYLSKWVEAKALPTNDARVVCKFLKSLFARFGAPRAIISDYGKLKSCWSGPFTIAKVFPYGTVKISHVNGTNFKVNGHRIKHYFGGDVPQLVVPDLQTFPLDQP
nr:reverse transcriptase domain-containing protein [Tanacetum cinerariifolium]